MERDFYFCKSSVTLSNYVRVLHLRSYINKLLFLGGALISLDSSAQGDTVSFFEPSPWTDHKRVSAVIFTETALAVTTVSILNEQWYKNYPRSAFHLFNDNDEWLQMDKAGHLTTSYFIGRTGINLLKWSGVERRKAAWFGGMLGSAYLGAIEVLDGFSTQWGFSYGDIAANTLGSGIVTAQELIWSEQRISLKYSFRGSRYSQYRPSLLGWGLSERMLKDYNGQTYWMSVNIHSFLNEEARFPRWLNVAFGYGADGMTGGRVNPVNISGVNGDPVVFDRYRQYYFSLDVDLSKIRTRSHFLKALFETVGFVKFPAPALEVNKNGMRFNALGF